MVVAGDNCWNRHSFPCPHRSTFRIPPPISSFKVGWFISHLYPARLTNQASPSKMTKVHLELQMPGTESRTHGMDTASFSIHWAMYASSPPINTDTIKQTQWLGTNGALVGLGSTSVPGRMSPVSADSPSHHSSLCHIPHPSGGPPYHPQWLLGGCEGPGRQESLILPRQFYPQLLESNLMSKSTKLWQLVWVKSSVIYE